MAKAQAKCGTTSDVTGSIQALNVDDEKNINVLLLGPSKSGLSTFVNAFANYITYKSLDSAEKGKLIAVVPSCYTIVGKDTEEHEVPVSPEFDLCDYDSIRTYSIPLSDGKTNLHMICVPAVENLPDEEEDDNNLCYEDILSYIAQTEILHAICCIFPVNSINDSALNLFFEQCFYKLLSRLNNQVYNNLIFVFTHSQATYYTAGTSLSCLKKFLNSTDNNDLQKKINFEGKNTFYFENNSFMYLAALQKNIEFDVDVKKRYNETWNHSYKESLRFIDYLTGSDWDNSLTPYNVGNNTSVVMARWIIIKLLQPIADILDCIKNNLATLQERLELLSGDNLSLQDVEGKLNIPAFSLRVTSLPLPVTMCANGENNQCAIYHTVGNIQTWRMQRCHECCYLKSPPRYLIGDMSLLDCEEMVRNISDEGEDAICQQCGCNMYNHMHLYYMTRLEESTRYELPPSGILSEQIQQITTEIINCLTEYELEMKTIVESAAEFVHFMQNEGIAPYDDPYETYLQYLINREEISGNIAGEKNILQMSTFLEYYQERKDTLVQASNLCKRLGDEISLPLGKITPEKVMKSVDVLYSLKHTGSKIKELVESQHVARTKEYKHTVTEISLCYSKDTEHNKDPQKRFRSRRNWNEDCGNEHGDDKNQRGNFRGRGNRGRYGGYRGNFHQNFHLQQPHTENTEMSQPPAYSQLYPNVNCALDGNLNSQQPNQQHSSDHQSRVPYVQINVISDSSSQGAGSRQTDLYTGNEGRGGYCQQARGSFKPNRGGFRGNRGGRNRPWNNNRQNPRTGQQKASCNQDNASNNQQPNTGFDRQHSSAGNANNTQQQRTGFQRHQPANNANNNQQQNKGGYQRQTTSHNNQSNSGVNQQQNARSHQNQTQSKQTQSRNNPQNRAAGWNQNQNANSGQQKPFQNQQCKSNQSNQGSAGYSQRQNTNNQNQNAHSGQQKPFPNQQRKLNQSSQGSAGSSQRRTNESAAGFAVTTLSQNTIRSFAKRKQKTDCVVM